MFIVSLGNQKEKPKTTPKAHKSPSKYFPGILEVLFVKLPYKCLKVVFFKSLFVFSLVLSCLILRMPNIGE